MIVANKYGEDQSMTVESLEEDERRQAMEPDESWFRHFQPFRDDPDDYRE